MKALEKFGITFLFVFLTIGMLWAQSSVYESAPTKPDIEIVSKALLDLQFEWPVGYGGAEQGIETDGNFIYTTNWNSAEFCRYNMDGTYIGLFTCLGAENVRDMAYNGTYFYGAAVSPIVFEMDFDAQTVISTYSAPVNCRAIAYNEDDDFFYTNNFGSDILVQLDMSITVLHIRVPIIVAMVPFFGDMLR